MGQKISTNNNITSSIEQEFVVVPSTKSKTNNLNNSENFENIESLENVQDNSNHIENIIDEVLKSIQENVKVKCNEIDSNQLQSVKLKPTIQKKYNKIDHIQLRSIKLKPTIQKKYNKIDNTQLRYAKLKLKPTIQNKYTNINNNIKPKCNIVNVSEEKVKESKIKEVKAPQPSEAPKVPKLPVMTRNEPTKPFPRTLKEYYGVHEKKVKNLKKD